MRILTVPEVAELLHISPRTVRQWLREKLIPGRKVNRLWRVHEGELVASFAVLRDSGEK